ncbi:putative DNA methylase [Staphylothermus marinus F1]|uniref:DNA methylase n=2 Tax=Staphylothermus marinus TaxID=2280 RepID=A3DM23_STAMF|nr:putative DNA methylase [Staphylothermus marinus F1]
MVFWWTRKPLITARAVIAGSIIPADKIDPEAFKQNILRLDKNTPHRFNPSFQGELAGLKKLFKETSLLDPFAGFGSIPLEALRLGVGKVTAVELLPTAVVFLKAVLEYPLKTVSDPKWKNLAKDVEKWGKWIIEQLKNDQDLKELYDEDIAVYIGTWEVQCPHCKRYTPLIGNYWLARVKKNNKYTRIAYMKPVKRNNRVDIEVIDVNKKYKISLLDENKIKSNKITIPRGEQTIELEVPEKNIDPKKKKAKCLYCRNKIGYINPETGQHYPDKSNLPTSLRKKVEFYPKYALKQWNKLLEKYLSGEISLEELKKAPARPRILVKVKTRGKDLEFEPATQEDQEKLWKALEKIKQIWGDPDIPTEPIEPYCSSTYHTIVWGIDKFYKLFNPRQLLTLIKTVKLIREAGKKIEEEKLKNGWSEKTVFNYTEAVMTYLTISLLRYSAFNSITATIRADTLMGAIVAGSLTFRGIAMVWNYGEISPYADITGSWTRNLRSIYNGLTYLVSIVSENSSNVKVMLDDATMLRKLSNEKFDIIVTDPPYRDDVPYAELSDFYYVWLKRALCDIENGRLVPMFHRDLFFRRVGAVWKPISTQWEFFAKREVSFNPGRYRDYAGNNQDAEKYAYERYLELLSDSFIAMREHLKDDGLLVTYYNHTDPDAWRDLLWAGWARGGFRITATWPLDTESKQSIVKRGKRSLDTSLIIVWRKRSQSSRVGVFSDVYREAVEVARNYSGDIWKKHRGLDAFIGVMGRVLEVVTSYDKIVFPARRNKLSNFLEIKSNGKDLESVSRIIREIVFPAAARGLIDYLVGTSMFNVGSPEALFYLLFKLVFLRDPETARKLLSKEKKLDASSITILSIASGIDVDDMVKKRIVDEKRVPSTNKKEYVLNAPLSIEPSRLRVFLEKRRGINPDKPRISNSVDALHVLEYYASRYDKNVFEKLVSKLREQPSGPSFIDEAKGIAYVICSYFEGDPEQRLSMRMLEYMGVKCGPAKPIHKTIDNYIK